MEKWNRLSAKILSSLKFHDYEDLGPSYVFYAISRLSKGYFLSHHCGDSEAIHHTSIMAILSPNRKKCLVHDFLPAVLGDVRGPLDAVVPHLADEVEQVLRGEGRRAHHQLVEDAPEGPLSKGVPRLFQCNAVSQAKAKLVYGKGKVSVVLK